MVSPVVGTMLACSIAIVSIVPAMWVLGYCNGEQDNPDMVGCKSRYQGAFKSEPWHEELCEGCYIESPVEGKPGLYCEPIRAGKVTLGHECQIIPGDVNL